MINQREISIEKIKDIVSTINDKKEASTKKEDSKKIMIVDIFGVEKEFKPFKRPGRPFLYDTEEQIEEAVNEYFMDCERRCVPIGVCGLALALGMTRMTFKNYSDNENFGELISFVKARIEQYQEEQMLVAKNPAAWKFSLGVNFGWNETVKSDITLNNVESLLSKEGSLEL